MAWFGVLQTFGFINILAIIISLRLAKKKAEWKFFNIFISSMAVAEFLLSASNLIVIYTRESNFTNSFWYYFVLKIRPDLMCTVHLFSATSLVVIGSGKEISSKNSWTIILLALFFNTVLLNINDIVYNYTSITLYILLILSVIFCILNVQNLQETRRNLAISLIIIAIFQTIYFTQTVFFIFKSQYSINILTQKVIFTIITVKPVFYFIFLEDFRVEVKQLFVSK